MSADSFESFFGTDVVPGNQAFDVERLSAWLQPRLEGFEGVVQVEEFRGGVSNPTYLLRTGDRRWVLRRQPHGLLLPSAHAVDREFRVLQALAATDVPVPRAYVLCEDLQVMGALFYVMEYVEGRIFWDPQLPRVSAQERVAMYDDMNRVMAALHRVDPVAVGLVDFGKPGNYVARQVGRWTGQYRATETEHIEAVDNLIEWLPLHIPRQETVRIVHGDFRLDNLIFHPTKAHIIGVLDWELSTLGDPLVDFAYHCIRWRMPVGASRGMAGADVTALGIPQEADYVARYLERIGNPHGVSGADWNFYLVFNMFRLVGILQGVAMRARQDPAMGSLAHVLGARARPMAEQAWALAQTLKPTYH